MSREYVGMRINPEIIKAIDKIAKEQNRNRSNAIEWILADWLREHRHELFKPVIKETLKEVLDGQNEIEGLELLAWMPGDEVADGIEAVKDVKK